MNSEALDLLRCPRCRGLLSARISKDAVRCESCLLDYPVDADVPALLLDVAVPVTAPSKRAK